MKLYNTLSRTKEVFHPIKGRAVGLYSCGPTVYNYAHIGNLRTYIFVDILKRILIYDGYKVKHIMNITDVGHLTSDADSGEDKMLLAVIREKRSVWDIAEFYTQAFKEDIKKLTILEPTVWCKATDHILEQIELIKTLEEKGFAYHAGGNVYFDTAKFSDYGKLALLDLFTKQQARVKNDPNKKNVHDFVLWFTKSKFGEQDMRWESPWGVGYPGWHIECSAMSMKYLSRAFDGKKFDPSKFETIDIHTGGIDHIPIHHTNEIAQSEAATGGIKMADFWLHGEFLVVDNSKMAKSEGNFITLSTIKGKGYDPLAYRYFCLQAHYRQQLNFSWEILTAAQNGYHGLIESLRRIRNRLRMGLPVRKSMRGEIDVLKNLVKSACVDDLNVPKALGFVHLLISKFDLEQPPSAEDAHTIIDFIFEIDNAVLGLKLEERSKQEPIPQEVEDIVMEREKARQDKDWARADVLRKELEQAGFLIEDTSQGPIVSHT